MNQNTSVDNDLQRAIDDITKTTAGDPIFADPVAAPEVPTSMPEPEFEAPMPPAAPMPEAMPAPMPAPMPTAPMPPRPQSRIVDPMIAPAGNNQAPTFTPPMPAPMPNPTPIPEAPVASTAMPAAPEPIVPAGSNKIEEEIVTVAPFMETPESALSVKQVKEAALRGLAPIVGKMDVPAEQKFDIYKNVIDNYHDSSVLEPALRAANEISDDVERGEALLYIVDSIDDMEK